MNILLLLLSYKILFYLNLQLSLCEFFFQLAWYEIYISIFKLSKNLIFFSDLKKYLLYYVYYFLPYTSIKSCILVSITLRLLEGEFRMFVNSFKYCKIEKSSMNCLVEPLHGCHVRWGQLKIKHLEILQDSSRFG